MTGRPRFNLIDIVAHDYDATLAFYRRFGAEVEDGLPGEIRHAHIHYDGVDVHIDNEHLAGIYNSSWRAASRPGSFLDGLYRRETTSMPRTPT